MPASLQLTIPDICLRPRITCHSRRMGQRLQNFTTVIAAQKPVISIKTSFT